MADKCLNLNLAGAALTLASAPLGWTVDDPALQYLGGVDKGFCIDLASPECFSRQAAPLNADPLVNYANGALVNNGSVVVDGGIAFAGGGFDFTACVRYNNFVAVPNAFDAIQADANKEWTAVLWIKFPAAADWPASGVSVSVCSANPYATGADLFTLYLANVGGTKNIVMRVQTAIGAATALGAAPGATFGGKLCQVLVYRKADGTTTWRVKAADASATFQDATVNLAANTANLAGLTWRWGLLTPTQTAFPTHDPLTANDASVAKHRFYRALVVSTKGASKSVTDIADGDFADTVARAVYA